MLGVYWFLYANVCGNVVTCVVVCEFVGFYFTLPTLMMHGQTQIMSFLICSALFMWYCSVSGLCHFLYTILLHVRGTVVKTNIRKSMGVENTLAKM